ncbi:MAG: hypothetical protein QOE36_1290 [Gaiellaceae bacterium]|jgi:hypothetical protein|nr:hypothetical protein [Gaiellaceae bacterium]
MARPRYPRSSGPLPPPLPPETRTVGQLVAETIRLYGRRFWLALPLGLPLAVLDEISFRRSLNVQTVILWAFSPLLTLTFAAAAAIVGNVRPTPRVLLSALAAGIVVFAPFPVLARLFLLPALALLAFAGLAVPAAVLERLGPVDAIRRGVALGRVDYVHALGGIATLAIVYGLSRYALLFLLRTQGNTAERIAGFISDIVLSPLLFLGPAMLYVDQAARARLRASAGGAAVRSSSR